jgi:opacity protein-like surface antigen
MGLALAAHPVAARADSAQTWLAGMATAGLASLTCVSVALITGEDAVQDEFAGEDAIQDEFAGEDAIQDEFDRQGWLIGVAGIYAIETFKDDAESDAQDVFGPTASLSVDNSFGVNGRVGYRCHRWFSAEVGVEWLDGFKTDLSAFGNIGIDIEPIVATANLKGYLLTGRYQPFLLIGAGFMTVEAKVRDTADLGLSASEKETDFAMRFGGGIDLYATKHVVVSVEADYVLPFGSLDDVDYISIGWGFQYRF